MHLFSIGGALYKNSLVYTLKEFKEIKRVKRELFKYRLDYFLIRVLELELKTQTGLIFNSVIGKHINTAIVVCVSNIRIQIQLIRNLPSPAKGG